jgi:hypothetical protein
MKIHSSEEVISGAWTLKDGRLIADAECARIAELIRSGLKLLGRDASGWDAIYRDPEDGRLWEMTYPHSELQGGGPPRLTCLTRDQALQKYESALLNVDVEP